MSGLGCAIDSNWRTGLSTGGPSSQMSGLSVAADGQVQVHSHAIIDGGFATEIVAGGVDVDSDELWSASCLIDKPELIRAVHLKFYESGADVGITASYQASFEGFEKRGLDREKAVELMHLSVQLAREARDAFHQSEEGQKRRKPVVAASVGPYGAVLHDGSEYTGHYGLSLDELVAFHTPRMLELAAASPDFLAIETIPCLVEVQALLISLDAVNAEREKVGLRQMQAWVTVSSRDHLLLNDGSSVTDFVKLCETSRHVFAIGVNCTAPKHIEGWLLGAREHTSKHLLTYPNSGESWDGEAHDWKQGEEPPLCKDSLHQLVTVWYEAGATIIGGCCRVSPQSIGAMARQLQQLSSK